MRSNATFRAWRAALWVAVVLAALLYLPTPYVVMAPGDAVDLRDAIHVDEHASPPRPFYLTDVLVYPASPLGLISTLVPGYRILPRSVFAPPGVPSDRLHNVLLRGMEQSQQAAAVVAERAAGYRVATPLSRVLIVAVLQESKAKRILEPGDVVVGVDGRRVSSLESMIAAVGKHPVNGPPAHLVIDRDGTLRPVVVGTIDSPEGEPRIGVLVASEPGKAHLAVPVRFGGELTKITGSSGGLMMALDIYATLTGRRLSNVGVAGTGTLDFDGDVGPIDGALQKIIAAKRAGAKIFLCPRDNYKEIKDMRGIRVLPVSTFDDARRALAKVSG